MTQQTLTQSERRGYVQSQHVLSKHGVYDDYEVRMFIVFFFN